MMLLVLLLLLPVAIKMNRLETSKQAATHKEQP